MRLLTAAVLCFLQAAQPALLYIVPAVLGAVAVHAQLRGEFLQAGCSACTLKLHGGEFS